MSKVLIGILLLLLGYLLWNRRRLKKEVQFHQLQEQDLDTYSLEVESIYRQIRALKHDYRNHLQNLQALLQQEKYLQLEEYLAALIHEQNQVDTIIKTGNTLIDAIVNTKLTKARDEGVKITAQAIAPGELPLSQVDLSIILGNLLTNALEATTKSPSEDAFIRVYIAPMKGNLYINVTNSMTVTPQKNYLSLKGMNRQGYGLHRIQQTVEKYHGIVNRQWEEGVFSTEITLPLTQ